MATDIYTRKQVRTSTRGLTTEPLEQGKCVNLFFLLASVCIASGSACSLALPCCPVACSLACSATVHRMLFGSAMWSRAWSTQ